MARTSATRQRAAAPGRRARADAEPAISSMGVARAPVVEEAGRVVDQRAVGGRGRAGPWLSISARHGGGYLRRRSSARRPGARRSRSARGGGGRGRGRRSARRWISPCSVTRKRPPHRAGRLGADGAAGRPAAARHAAAAPVEEREARRRASPADAGDRFLRPVERPVGREVAAVLVAVGVADHHHLLAAARRQVGAVGLQREELGQDARRRVEIVERLEERRDLEARRRRRPSGRAGARSSTSAAPRVIEIDERAERARARRRRAPGRAAGRARHVSARRVVERRPAREAAAGGGARRRGAQRVRAVRSASSRLEAAGAMPEARRSMVAQRRGEAPGVLADVEPRGVEAEQCRAGAGRSAAGPRPAARAARAATRSSAPASSSTCGARPVRRVVEQPRRHVLARGGLEIGGQQRQREAVGLARRSAARDRRRARAGAAGLRARPRAPAGADSAGRSR